MSPKPEGGAPGQQKLHEVRNPTTGETRQVTQEQWRNRREDPSLGGFERVDGDEAEGGGDDTPTT
jgi:hypothetical protein